MVETNVNEQEYLRARDEALGSPAALSHHLFTLHHARAQRCADAGDVEGSERERWFAQAYLALRTTREGVFALRDDAMLEPDSVWSRAPAHVYEHVYEKATSTEEPAPIRVVLLQALWELRRVWAGLRPAIAPSWEIGVAAIEAHVEAAEYWSARSRDAAFAVYVVDHVRTAVSLAEAMHKEYLIEKALVLSRREAQCFVSIDVGLCLRLLEIEIAVAARRRHRTRPLVDQARLEDIERTLIDLEARLPADAIPGLHENALEARFDVEALVGRPSTTEERAARVGRLAQARAQAQPEPMLAVSYWKQAAEQFQQAGLHDEEVHASNAARHAVAAATRRFQRVPFEVPVDRGVVDRLIASVDATGNVLGALWAVGSDLFMAPADRVRPRGISDLIPLEHFVGDRSLAGHVPDSDGDRRARLVSDLRHELTVFNAGYLLPVMEHLRDACGLTAIDRDLAWLLRVMLTEETGFNVRNRVAHGWARAPELNCVSAARILHLVLAVSVRERKMALERMKGTDAAKPAPEDV